MFVTLIFWHKNIVTLNVTLRYWDSKFRNLSPFPLPDEMPDDSLELARMAIEQITCVDQLTEISLYNTEELEESTEDKTWIISG